ncbi:hypothetical protein F5Y18DRAFT_433082 [Xylariaceae sp. FL1019]|nr:hypothetical protein F5Y18DRAFT_433082 [Xylariaceae sp. FL1019]
MAQDETKPPPVRGPPPGATEVPDHVKKPQIYEVFNAPTPSETQTQKPEPRPTMKDAFDSIKTDEFLTIHQLPCAREGFMTGIGAGVAVGAGRYFVGGKAPKAANWAFGAFFLGSIIQWEYCQAQRRKERAAMARAVEIIDRKQAEKKAQAAETARLKREAYEKAQQEQKKSWYKFW